VRSLTRRDAGEKNDQFAVSRAFSDVGVYVAFACFDLDENSAVVLLCEQINAFSLTEVMLFCDSVSAFEQFLLRLVELEMMDRERRSTERRIKSARFPVTKSLETYNFLAIPTLNKKLVVELARGEWISRRENVLALGNSGTGKTHIGLALGLAACQQGFRVRFTTAASLVHELMEAKDEKRLLRYQRILARQELLIVDELGFVPLSKTGAEMLFEVFSQRYERASTLVTSNLPFAEWTEVLGSERLTGALLDRLTHHVHILEMNGDSYRLKSSRKKRDTGGE
jgi:DNA replication protein DnaC